MATESFCPFYSKPTSLECWDFKGPKGNGLEDKGGYWNFSLTETPSFGTGPSTGHTHGYVYCETNSPTKKGDVFEMITKEAFDFSYEGGTTFYYHANVQKVQFDVEVWDGYKWVNEFSLIPEPKDEWIYTDLNFHRYTNNDSFLKFKITILSDTKTYLNDFGLDTITIESFDGVIDDDIDFAVESKNFKKLKKGRNKNRRYVNEELTSEEVKLNIENLIQQVKNGELILDEDLIIHENEKVSHLIKKDEKWQ